jgi:hypothetical protein
MPAQRITQMIDPTELRALVEATRGEPAAQLRPPSALRGLAQLVLLAVVFRELWRWLI